MSLEVHMVAMKMDNARKESQLRKMKLLEERGLCHFCPEGFALTHDAPIIYRNDDWYITACDDPYDGSVHHYLIVSAKHVTRLREIRRHSRIQLFQAQVWLEDHLEVTGSSMFVRSGDMDLTCATLDHLHFHFVVGERKIGDEPNKLEDLIVAPVGYKKK